MRCLWSLLIVMVTLSCAHSDEKNESAESLLPARSRSVSAQHLVYLNARLAKREERPKDALKLWLLRNALESKGEVPENDGDFRSVVWASLGDTGYCQDGIIDDDQGAGLWPLALHNWLLRGSSKQPAPEQPNPFSSLEGGGVQQRLISLHDVLSYEEMKSLRFFRGDCWFPYITLARLPTLHWLDIKDRLSQGLVLRDLLERAQKTLSKDRVQTQVLLETRLFDLEASLSKLAEKKIKRETGMVARVLRTMGVSESGVQLLRDERLAEYRKSDYTNLLKRALQWRSESWLSLSQNRRLALFASSDKNVSDTAAKAQAVFLMVDTLESMKQGGEAEAWLSYLDDYGEEYIDRAVLGARGERLMSLEPESGFRERATIALHRGVDYLQRGAQRDALRSFAYALGHADESKSAEPVHSLAKRWLSYVLSQYESDDEVMAILNNFVAPTDRDELFESLLWRAAFHVDEKSFERVANNKRKRTKLSRLIEQLRPLSKGDAKGVFAAIENKYSESPYAIWRFVDKLVGELSLEPLDVRSNNRATLAFADDLLERKSEGASKSVVKKIDELRTRIQVLRDAIDEFDNSAFGRARAQRADYETYAGSVRLAPADPLPWPFAKPNAVAPSPFAKIKLTPIEWKDKKDDVVFGWKIHE